MSGEYYRALVTIRGTTTCSEDVSLVVAASYDAGLCSNTYLKPRMTASQATEYLSKVAGTSWIVAVGGLGVGFIHYYETTPYGSFTPAENSVEIGTWLLDNFRGYGLGNMAQDMLLPILQERRVRHLVFLVWSTNTASISQIRKSGADFVLQVLWDDTRDDVDEHDRLPSGLCDVWVRHI